MINKREQQLIDEINADITKTLKRVTKPETNHQKVMREIREQREKQEFEQFLFDSKVAENHNSSAY